MPNRVQVFRGCQFILLGGVLLGACAAMSAQSTSNAPSSAPQATAPAVVPDASGTAVKSNPPAPAIKFEDVIKMILDEGDGAGVRRDIVKAFDLTDYSQMPAEYFGPPLHAFLLSDEDSPRQVYYIDGTHNVLFTTQTGGITVLYLTNRAGVLQKAAQINVKGRFKSESIQSIPLKLAAGGFDAEREFWMKKAAAEKTGKSGQAAGKAN